MFRIDINMSLDLVDGQELIFGTTFYKFVLIIEGSGFIGGSKSGFTAIKYYIFAWKKT